MQFTYIPQACNMHAVLSHVPNGAFIFLASYNQIKLLAEVVLLMETSLRCALWEVEITGKRKSESECAPIFTCRLLNPRAFSAYYTRFSRFHQFLTLIDAFLCLRRKKSWDGKKSWIIELQKTIARHFSPLLDLVYQVLEGKKQQVSGTSFRH